MHINSILMSIAYCNLYCVPSPSNIYLYNTHYLYIFINNMLLIPELHLLKQFSYFEL